MSEKNENRTMREYFFLLLLLQPQRVSRRRAKHLRDKALYQALFPRFRGFYFGPKLARDVDKKWSAATADFPFPPYSAAYCGRSFGGLYVARYSVEKLRLSFDLWYSLCGCARGTDSCDAGTGTKSLCLVLV